MLRSMRFQTGGYLILGIIIINILIMVSLVEPVLTLLHSLQLTSSYTLSFRWRTEMFTYMFARSHILTLFF